MRDVQHGGILGAAAVALALLAVSTHATGQEVVAPHETASQLRARMSADWARPGQPMPADQVELDAMVSQGRFVDMTRRLTSANNVNDVLLDMNWEQARIFNGGGFIIALSYMRDLWRTGSYLPPPNGDQLKRSAGAMLLYTFALIRIDGPQCGDPTAPGHRMDQLGQQGQSIFAFIKTLPRADRMRLGTAALKIEAATAPVRTQDEVLCRDGLQQSLANTKAWGDKPAPETPCPPGMFGTCRSIPDDPKFKVQFLSPEQWKPKQAAARDQMPGQLTQLLTLPSDTAPSPSAPPQPAPSPRP